MNNGARIVIDRRGTEWWWTVTARGEMKIANKGQPTPQQAAEEAEIVRGLIEGSRVA